MSNIELLKKIINMEISLEELINFNSEIDKKEFDLELPFSKYYNLNTIIKVLDNYKNKKIGANYLSYWCNAYNWIINGGFKEEVVNNYKENSLVEIFAMSKISDTLDGISFFDSLSVSERNDLVKEGLYSTDFTIYDKLLKSPQDWEMLLVKGWQYELNNEYDAIFIDKKAKEYFLEVDEEDLFDIAKANILEVEDFTKLVEKLHTEGYTNIGMKTIESITS